MAHDGSLWCGIQHHALLMPGGRKGHDSFEHTASIAEVGRVQRYAQQL